MILKIHVWLTFIVFYCPELFFCVQQEFRGTPRTKTKTSKFRSPANEMCSACLTPVYPVERMVVNKLTLHHNCFCCKHCKKKLSTHNYSSLYGEFYCISHYQQLFKRRGNYDEGFGHTQHKDRWLHKNTGTDEPDAKATSKMTKNNLKTPAELLSPTAGINERKDKSVADVKGKLKVRWPPERNITRSNPTQLTNAPVLKNKAHEAGKPATVGESERWRSDKPDYRREMTNTAGKGQSKTVNLVSAKKSPPGKPVSMKDSTKSAQISIPPMEREIPLRTSVKNQRAVQTRVVTLSKLNSSPVSNNLEAFQNKVRKSVRFAQKVDVALCDQSRQIGSGAESENSPEQSEQSLTSSSQHETETNDMEVDSLSNGLEESNGTPEMTLCQDNRDPTTEPNQESNVDVETRQEMPRMDDVTLPEDVEEVKGSLDCQSHTDISSLTEDNTTQHEPSEKADVASTGQVSTCGSEDLNGPQNPAGHVTEEEASLEMNENQLTTASSNSEKENTAIQKKALPRTNSKTKLGSLSKGRSPLTKLFTSTGNDKATRVETKDAKKTDVKPGGGLFGRLFQSSSDATKTPAQPEEHTKTSTANETAEMEPETKTEENKGENISEVAPLEPEAPNQTSSELSEETITTSIEQVNLSQESIKETSEHLPTPEKTDENPAYQESDLNITAATDQSASDPEKQPEILLTDTSLPNPDPEQSVIESTPEGSSDEHLIHPVVDDNFGEVVSSTQAGDGSIQISTDESSPNSDKLLDAPDETGGNLSSETLFSSSAENPQDQTNFFDLSESSSLAGSSPLSASAETAAALPHDFSLMDTQLLSAEAEASLVMTDPPPDPDSALLSVKQEDNLDPFSGVNQTNDQIADFDIFGSSNDLFSHPILFDAPDPNGEEVSTNQFSAFPDDIFGVSHTSDSTALFPVQPNISNVSNSLNDLLGSDAPSTVAPPTQIDLFAGDIFATDAQLLAVAEPSDADVFGDNLLVSEGNNTEQKSESSSWMDDLLG
uniref:Xin actin-binding repeat-containing protein 1-like n=1 Tax=Xiphophorus maculatus TaxID=8083 RepID=A0A3B5PVD5_XIPMA